MEPRGQRSLREAVLAVALLLCILHSSSSVSFRVEDSKNITCILADLSANFTVEYNIGGGKKGKASFVLPGEATLDQASNCGKENSTGPLLAIKFGNNHSLSINFTKVDAKYQVDELVFAYNLSDKTIFPDASDNGTATVNSKNSAISADISSVYRCSNPHLITIGNVNITFHDVKLEAYMTNNNFSKTETLCKEDVSPSPSPTPTPTKPAPTPSPTPTGAPTPKVGEYRINDTSGKACILAKMGLQLNFTYTIKNESVANYEYIIDPKQVNVTGNCLNSSATLILSSDAVYLLFNFTLNNTASQVYLGHVHVNTTVLPEAKDPKFNQDSGSLSLLQTTEHKSYKCSSKQNLQITSNFSIDTNDLQIQAFDIQENKFGPPIECAADQNGMLVPIVVGAALAGLVLIVLIAYLIGRKRSHAGYQTI